MNNRTKRKKFRNIERPLQLLDTGRTQDVIVDGYAPAQMIEDLRKYQAELEIQNKALRYSQQEAEGASERFATLFSNVPLALMVVDEEGLVMASNAMALRLFQPLENDPPCIFCFPLSARCTPMKWLAPLLMPSRWEPVKSTRWFFYPDHAAPLPATCTWPASKTRRTS